MRRKSTRFKYKSSTQKEVISEKDLIGEHLSTIMIHLIFLFVLALIIFPIISFIYFDSSVIFISIFFLIVVVYNTELLLDNFDQIGFKKLFHAIKFLFKNRKIQFVGLTVVNVLIILNVGFMTLIPTSLTLFIFPIFILIFLFKKSPNRYSMAIVKVPLIINFLFVINYFVSFDAIEETYTFSRNYQFVRSRRGYGSGGSQLSSLITLPKGKYDEYYGIRTFISIEKLKFASKITYTTKRGLFGIRVVSNYKFS